LYPGAEEPVAAKEKLSALLSVGIRAFVDLTEAGERNWAGVGLAPYEDMLRRLSANQGMAVQYRRFPIPDQSICGQQQLCETVEFIDKCIDAGQPVYVHCWGGKGRTGTVVGSWLLRHGLAEPEDFVQVIAALRRDDPGNGRSPETDEQEQFVRDFARGER
jgi:hypothetical protein